jgi:hypothetical protein
MSAPWRRIPIHIRVGIGVGVVALALFAGAVVPLLLSGGATPTAEVNGSLPHSLTLGTQASVSLALDNTSDAIIKRVCIRVAVDPAGTVTPVSASFSGLETVPFSGGLVCGGSLSGNEVISVRMLLQGARTGSARVTLVASNGTADIGPQHTAIVGVVAPGS